MEPLAGRQQLHWKAKRQAGLAGPAGLAQHSLKHIKQQQRQHASMAIDNFRKTKFILEMRQIALCSVYIGSQFYSMVNTDLSVEEGAFKSACAFHKWVFLFEAHIFHQGPPFWPFHIKENGYVTGF